MIEIGRERTAGSYARRVAKVIGTIGSLLLLVWLFRGWLSIQQYSQTLLLTSFGLFFIGRAFRTRTGDGAARAASSFLGNIATACLLVLIGIWILGWVAGIQGDVFPSLITAQVPNLVIAAIATGVASYAIREASPMPVRAAVQGPAILIAAQSKFTLGQASISMKAETVGLPIKKQGKTIGCVLFGDAAVSFDTPMGPVAASLGGPVTTFGIKLIGARVGRDEVARRTGSSLQSLLERTKVDDSMGVQDMSTSIDVPFVHVRKDTFGESVDVGPISVRRGPGGETVRIGPFSFDTDVENGHDFGARPWLAKGANNSTFLTASESSISAKWNGSSLKLAGNSMRFSVGSDGFIYSPTELETYSPLHALHITGEKVVLTTKKFTLDINDERVVLRTESGSKKTDSMGLSKDLRTFLADVAKKHVQNVMQGQPIDLDETFTGTDQVLNKYE